MPIAEHRQVAALDDNNLFRAIPIILDLLALNLYRTMPEGWKSWAKFEKDCDARGYSKNIFS